MGHKVVCIDCRKSFSQGTDFKSRRKINCLDCGEQMIFLPHRFRPPKKTNTQEWKTVAFLIKNGFLYQHIYKVVEAINNNIIIKKNRVPYPKTLSAAKEFVLKYKGQATYK